MQKILIDCRFAALHVGLGRYTRELVTHLYKQSSSNQYVLLVRNQQEEWIPKDAQTVEADIPHYSLQEQTVLPKIIRLSGADLFFCPHFNVPFFCPVPFIVTVHDLILHRYPNHASLLKRIAYHCIIGNAVRKAKSIVAVSNFTAQELSQVYGSSIAKKTIVIHEGVSDIYHPLYEKVIEVVLQKFAITRPYFLYVGNAKEHKNVQILIDAFHDANLHEADLLLVSGGPEAASLTLGANVRILPSVSDRDLPALYSGANALVTASLYEGYCLPVAEALACGCPVIASNRTVIPETADGHAMLIEPTREAFAKAFLHPPTDRARYVVGTWEKAAVLINNAFSKSSSIFLGEC